MVNSSLITLPLLSGIHQLLETFVLVLHEGSHLIDVFLVLVIQASFVLLCTLLQKFLFIRIH